ncbi:MAG: hypothetical protein AAGH67_17950 [Cyanobacteria bacterium P01_H01_bin.162]
MATTWRSARTDSRSPQPEHPAASITARYDAVVVPPEGWPEGSPLLKGMLNSYTTVGLCHQKLTPRYRASVHQAQATKPVYHLQSLKDVEQFYQSVRLSQ